MKRIAARVATLALAFQYAESALATEFEKLGTAIAKVLGTTKAARKNVKVGGKSVDVFYSKAGGAKPKKFAVVQKGIYEPNCTHTWVVGLDGKAAVNQIRVVEMSCSHAFPTRQASFLDQYKGRGPASVKSLKDEVQTVAKATGSSELTTTAVMTAIQAVKAF